MLNRIVAFFAVGLFSASGLVAQDNGQPQLYFFTNPGCGPCKQVEPEINLLISKGYPVTVVDTTQRPDLVQKFNVNQTPLTLLVANSQVAGRRAGFIDALTIVGWFDSAKATQPTPNNMNSTRPSRREAATQREAMPRRDTTLRGKLNARSLPNTLHKGTRKPNGEAEFIAMRATVRLKVEDPQGISFASGTVIHSQDGECLVLTCGHVFRDARGKGKISADLGFESNETKTYPGRLVSYNSGSKDIALVVIETGFDLPAVPVAPAAFPVSKGDQVFAIGCDHGQDATIRRTRIKRQAFYSSKETPNDKAKKYDIYGRPVDGRSGGGLFTAGGQLIGVCNAAAVEVDEGVYTALDNIYWQLAQVNLSHLFDRNNAIEERDPNPRFRNDIAVTPQRVQPLAPPAMAQNPGRRDVERLTPMPTEISDTQVIVILQSKSSPNEAETLVINNPSAELIDQLRAGQGTFNPQQDRFARLRQEMPRVDRPGSSREYRAQSPR